MTIDSPLVVLPGVGPSAIKKLDRLNLRTVRDLLEYAPRRYDDWTAVRLARRVRIGETATIHGEIVWAKNERSARRPLVLTKALIRDLSGELIATWFNQPFLLQSLPTGQQRYLRGAVSFDRSQGMKVLMNPQIAPAAHIEPIYPATAGLTSRMIRRLITAVLPLASALPDSLPAAIRRREELLTRSEALRVVHQPEAVGKIAAAHRRLAFDELLAFFGELAQLRASMTRDAAPALTVADKELRRFADSLPFKLTDDQRRAAWAIVRDIAEPVPMNRLLEGDVGSGKTAVAALAAFVAARSGYQTIVLAPTTVLADQHVASFKQLLAPFGITVGQWTGLVKAAASARPPDVLVGTHALFQGRPPLGALGLLVVDEQHRFGVEQRAVLRKRGTDGTIPHFLSMTATPIPRTLALALYGDLAVSRIESLPADRLPIKTRVVGDTQRRETYQFIRAQVAAGRQAYVVCPMIDESGADGTLFGAANQASVKVVYEHLTREVFSDLRVGLLHGKLSTREKQLVMDRFKKHESDILVATPVIEVGIDVANATTMLIEGAEHFGLSQLHQLRGRVGRGRYQSYCFLFTRAATESAARRLAYVETETSGFELAEIDLRLRGPGEFIGQNQAGFPPFRYADIFDFALLKRARDVADELFQEAVGKPVELVGKSAVGGKG